MVAAYAWSAAEGSRLASPAVYVFGRSDETLHLAGEKLGRTLLREAVAAARRAGPDLGTFVIGGMVVSGAMSRGAEYGCFVASRDEGAHAELVARSLWSALSAAFRSA